MIEYLGLALALVIAVFAGRWNLQTINRIQQREQYWREQCEIATRAVQEE